MNTISHLMMILLKRKVLWNEKFWLIFSWWWCPRFICKMEIRKKTVMNETELQEIKFTFTKNTQGKRAAYETCQCLFRSVGTWVSTNTFYCIISIKNRKKVYPWPRPQLGLTQPDHWGSIVLTGANLFQEYKNVKWNDTMIWYDTIWLIWYDDTIEFQQITLGFWFYEI